MKIPIYQNYTFKKDDVVVNIKPFQLDFVFFTEGHHFIYIKDTGSYCKVKDEEDGETYKILKKDITLFVSLSKAKERNRIILNRKKMINFIEKNCPHKYEKYDHYDSYDACKLKKGYGKGCTKTLECIQHISNAKIKKDEDVYLYLRELKIKKIRHDSRIQLAQN